MRAVELLVRLHENTRSGVNDIGRRCDHGRRAARERVPAPVLDTDLVRVVALVCSECMDLYEEKERDSQFQCFAIKFVVLKKHFSRQLRQPYGPFALLDLPGRRTIGHYVAFQAVQRKIRVK
jgi:hypothetical protein